MNRICINTKTNKLIEFQPGGAALGVLVENAVNAGYEPGGVEEKYTEDNLQTVLSRYQTEEEKIKKDDEKTKRNLIENKIKDMAIAELKKDGQLDNDGKLVR